MCRHLQMRQVRTLGEQIPPEDLCDLRGQPTEGASSAGLRWRLRSPFTRPHKKNNRIKVVLERRNSPAKPTKNNRSHAHPSTVGND